MCKNRFLIQCNHTLLIFGVLFIFTSIMTSTVQAQKQSKCDELLKDAEEQYRIGRFPEAITLLNECLAGSNIPLEKKTTAHRLRALAFMSQNLENEAKASVRKLLELVPDYVPDPAVDKPTFIKLVEEVKQEQLSLEGVKEEETPGVEPIPQTEREPVDLSEIIPEEKKSSTKKWFIIGGAGVAAGVVGFLVLSGGPDDVINNGGTPLGRPPLLPDRN